jgi:hypothetical protein
LTSLPTKSTNLNGDKLQEHGLRVAQLCFCSYSGDMNFIEIDHWIGKTLFVPPIIRLCQLTRQSQFAVARLFWFIAALDAFYRAGTLFSSILWGFMSLCLMLTASLRADRPTASSMFFRLLSICFLLVDLAKSATTGKWAGTEFWIFVLIAEYAGTIRTLPPRKSVARPLSRSQPSSAPPA